MGLPLVIEHKKRQSRYKPDYKKFPRVNIQDRDLEIIKEVAKDRFLTARQIQALFFNSYSAAQRRLQKLWNKGYLKREYAPVKFGSSEALYCPTKKGIDLLIQRSIIVPDEINWKSKYNRVKPEKKQHEIDANEFKVVLTIAVRENNYAELLFCERGSSFWDYVKDPDPDPKDKREYIPIRPDRFIGLKINGLSNYFFLEIDRGTMRLKECARKLGGLREYYFSGGFFKKYGQPGYKKEHYSYRVLITAPTEERRNNLVEKAIEQGSLEMCWFGLFSEVIQDPLGKVWIRGKEYKEVLERLAEWERERILRTHRKLERDEIIKKGVDRRSILE